MVSDWKEFEQLVAAIHQAATEGAEVQWNDSINGRQFDVTIRFQEGVYQYLTVVECKRYATAVPVADVEAFVTKSRGAAANKAVMVSSSGYQRGAVSVAERENIVLMTVTEEYEVPTLPTDAKPTDAINIYDVAMHFRDRSSIDFGDGAKLQYLLRHSWIEDSSGFQIALEDLIDRRAQSLYVPGLDATPVEIVLPRHCRLLGKNHQPTRADPERLTFTLKVIQGYTSRSTAPMDLHLMQNLARKYVLRTVDGLNVYEGFLRDLSLGAWDSIDVGHFYRIPSLGFYYYCESISGDSVTWVLIESYQHGGLLQARMKQKLAYGHDYVRVIDKPTISELQRLYDRLIELESHTGG